MLRALSPDELDTAQAVIAKFWKDKGLFGIATADDWSNTVHAYGMTIDEHKIEGRGWIIRLAGGVSYPTIWTYDCSPEGVFDELDRLTG